MNIRQQKAFTRRTYQCYSNTTRRLREKFGTNMSLPFTLEFFRREAEPCIGQLCLYCREKIGSTNFSLDHKIPLVRITEGQMLKALCDTLKRDFIDATDVIVFEWENCQIICTRCNKRKGDLTAGEFEKLVALMRTFPVAAETYVKRKLGASLAFYKKAGSPKLDGQTSSHKAPLFAKL